MSEKPRVLLDCDGVLSDFTSGVLAIISGEFDIWREPEDVTQWDIAKSLGLTSAQSSQLKKAIGSHAGFARKLVPFPGAVNGVARLREVADVYICTSPWNSNPTWMHDREWWLREHFDIPHSHVIHTSAKHVCVADFLVDDKTETCVRWSNENECMWDDGRVTGFAVQWQTPHNRLDEWHGRSTRDWNDLLAFAALVGKE